MQQIAIARTIFEEPDYAEVRSLLAELPDPEFRIVYLRYWASYEIAQIAKEMRMTWDSVDRRLTQALTKLRSMYGLNRAHFVSAHTNAA